MKIQIHKILSSKNCVLSLRKLTQATKLSELRTNFDNVPQHGVFFALQREINTKVEEVQQTCTFGDFVSACERLMAQTKDQTNELEAHLEKYGYIKPKGIKLIHCGK